MNNQEKKIEKWETIKKQIIEVVPDSYTIAVEGLDDDSQYFHPVISIDEGLIIRGQSDINGNNKSGVYAWGLRTEYPLGMFIHTIEFPIDDLEHIKKILDNWQKYKTKIAQYIDVCKNIEQNIAMLKEIQNTIQRNLLYDTFLREDRKKCLQQLFNVKEWIENERVIEKYSGLK
jgi:hypothetical protein